MCSTGEEFYHMSTPPPPRPRQRAPGVQIFQRWATSTQENVNLGPI